MICSGIFQDIDNSLLGKYIFKNKYNITPHKKYYKSIYRIFLVLFLCLLYKYCYNDIFKYGILFSISYFGTSVVSLFLQMFLENKIKHIEFIKQLEIIKQKCIITLQD